MLNIYISPKYFEEKSYVISIIFDEILGIKYKLQSIPDQSNYEITYGEKKIVIEDHFFSKMSGDLSYLSESNIPDEIKFSATKFALENDLPIIFGIDNVLVEEEKYITCGIDIFASSFFLLSRWEEHVVSKRDKFGRFPARESFAGKQNLLHRPLVNEYAEMIWNMITYIGFKPERNSQNFEFIATHDIDQPIRLVNLKMLTKSLIKNVFVFKDLIGGAIDVSTFLLNKFTPKFDLANSYDFLMQCSEQVGIKSVFNFQNANKTKFDWGYKNDSKFLQNIFHSIKTSGHIIGFHPSYHSYDNSELWKAEYDELCKLTNFDIKVGRQHFLRFKVPDTWQIWEENQMLSDSTLGFPQKEGFRCGTCSSYSVYNILTRKKLKLKETPLILMEKTLMNYQKDVSTDDFLKKSSELVDTTKKYNGKFVFLWHNSSFDRKMYTKEFYKKLISNNK
jgi:hypothetical protein